MIFETLHRRHSSNVACTHRAAREREMASRPQPVSGGILLHHKRGRFAELAKFAPFSAAPGPIAAARGAFAAFAGRCCDWPHVRTGWCENKRCFHFTCAHVLREEALSFFSLQGEVECCMLLPHSLTHTQSLAPASGCLLLIICYCCSNVGGGNFMSPVCICAHNR